MWRCDAAIAAMHDFNALNTINLTNTKVTKPVVDQMLDRRRAYKWTVPLFLNPTVQM